MAVAAGSNAEARTLTPLQLRIVAAGSETGVPATREEFFGGIPNEHLEHGYGAVEEFSKHIASPFELPRSVRVAHHRLLRKRPSTSSWYLGRSS